MAIFFGLSGTGKTTLSADPKRQLIGDAEHRWSDNGVFNFEDGCYAKVIRLSDDAEPQIYACTRRFGTVLENVTFDPVSRHLDLNDYTVTENTRATRPFSYIENHLPEKRAGHPKYVNFLTCDASGVMPPISKLTPDQAIYHFISGYTSKIAGTGIGLGTEPQMTFSTCFGGPFMVHHPLAYAELLNNKIQEHQAHIWLVNTTCLSSATLSRRRSSAPPARGPAVRNTSRSTTRWPPLPRKLQTNACRVPRAHPRSRPETHPRRPRPLTQRHAHSVWPQP